MRRCNTHFLFHDTVLTHNGLFNGINSRAASRIWQSHDVNGPTHWGVTAEQQQQNVSHYLEGGTHIMHDRHSTFKIKGFYLYAVNTVSFASFQWQHNCSTQWRGERLLCEREKYCLSSLQMPCTLMVTGFYSRFGQRKRCSVGEWLSTLQTERVSQGQATKRSVRQRGPRTPPQRSAAAVTLELSPSNNSSLL